MGLFYAIFKEKQTTVRRNFKMAKLNYLVLLCTLFVYTKSSAIGDAPVFGDSPLPEANQENTNVDDLVQINESKLVVREENATSVELSSSYCSQFDNSCVKCLKKDNCTMARYTKEVNKDRNVQEIDYELKCFDINASIKEIQEAFEDQRYDIIQKYSDCPQAPRANQNPANIHEKKSQIGLMSSTTDPSTPSD